MKRLLLILLLPFTLNAQQGIIGGNQQTIQDAPWMVSLYDFTNDGSGTSANTGPSIGFRGGGIILSDRWILTAAHVVAQRNPYLVLNPQNLTIQPNNLYIFSGTSKRAFTNNIPNTFNVQTPSKIIPHPNYQEWFGNSSVGSNDIALIELSTPLTFDHSQYPIEFANSCNTDINDFLNGQIAAVSGWGCTSAANNCSFSTYLKNLNMTYIDVAMANLLHGNTPDGKGSFFPNDQVISSMLALVSSGTGVALDGDSGGPAVIDKNGNNISIGVASWIYRNQTIQTTLPNIFTRVSDFESFILNPDPLDPTVSTNIIMPKPTLDLYTKDKPWDQGQEPFPNAIAWDSEDIWVRNVNDGIAAHQSPEYYSTPSLSNWVYVRVTNNSCVPSYGNEVLNLSWAKAATALAWPNHWDGSMNVGGQALGGLVGSITLPIIEPGDAYVHAFPWNPPNPAQFQTLYVNNTNVFTANEPHHFCLLSRIVSSTDPIQNEGTSVYSNVINNNNIAWKNVTVVDLDPNNINGNTTTTDRPVGANVFVGGMGDSNESFDIEFCNTPFPWEQNITEFAEVKITLSPNLWLKLEENGFQTENLEISNEVEHQLLLTSDCGRIKNLDFIGYEQELLHTSFNFLSSEIDSSASFHFNITQLRTLDESVIGGETFEIKIPERTTFDADAGFDEEIEEGQSVMLTANNIAENAIYNWYNQNGELVHTGTSLTVTPLVSEIYQLEVIAELDGVKDYDEVLVEVKENYISNISPNPAQNFINLEYKIKHGTNSAFLMLKNIQTNSSNQYLLNSALESSQIDINNLSSGNYSAILFVNGIVQDSRNLIIQ